ncbi:MAG: histidine phosphatase family protein [Pseudomonadota bacterium]
MPNLRLILLRHAKSAWDDLNLTDHARPLNERGRNDSKVIGVWLSAQGYLPDQVFCSTASRTVETWQRLSDGWSEAPEPRFLDDLYHAPPHLMRAVLAAATGNTVLMIGHNPGIAALGQDIVSTAPSHAKFMTFPTAATLVVDFANSNWSEAAQSRGVLVDFVVPKDLSS